MLQGFTKSKLTRLVKNQRNSPIEDLMTASIFGGLAFMPAQWASLATRYIFKGFVNNSDTLLTTECRFDRIEFWPRRDGVEPDSMLQYLSAQQQRALLIEVKWNADFHHKQALTQWHRFGSNTCKHILLVRDAGDAEAHIEGCDPGGIEIEWRQNTYILTWNQVSRNLQDLSTFLATDRTLAPLRDWSEHAFRCLDAFGEHCFTGFTMRQRWPEFEPADQPLFHLDADRIIWPPVFFTSVTAQNHLFFSET